MNSSLKKLHLKKSQSKSESGHKNLLFRVMKLRCIAFKLKFLFPACFLLITFESRGQNGNLIKTNSLKNSDNIEVSSLIDRQIEYIRNSYYGKIEAPREIINGKEYESYYNKSKNKPLLYSDKVRTASIITKTRRYNNITLQYDTFLDKVIYTDHSMTINNMFPQIALNKNNIDGFNLYFQDDSLIFRYLRLPECSAYNLKEGFYEIAYQGKTKYVIKHVSYFYVREGLNEYKYSPQNYISMGDKFYKIKSRRTLLRLFGEKSGEVKRFLHLFRIRIRQADKNQIVSVLKFYDSLVTTEK